MTPLEDGEIISFSHVDVRGRLRLKDGREFDFPSTAYRCVKTPRFPIVGEPVKVLISEGVVLGVAGGV